MRTTPAECAELGRITAEKLNRARGPVVFVMPLRGVSAIGSAGLPFSWPEADRSYLDALKANLDPRIRVAELDAHINDGAFARNAAHCLLELLEQSQGRDALRRCDSARSSLTSFKRSAKGHFGSEH